MMRDTRRKQAVTKTRGLLAVTVDRLSPGNMTWRNTQESTLETSPINVVSVQRNLFRYGMILLKLRFKCLILNVI